MAGPVLGTEDVRVKKQVKTLPSRSSHSSGGKPMIANEEVNIYILCCVMVRARRKMSRGKGE